VGGPAWLENRVMLWLGEISYGLYLWHYVLLELPIPVWAALTLALLAAAVSWYLIENPVLGWSERLARRRERPTTMPSGRDLARSR
jgi:peptidoglycan/LPS O-acetylase OafA/YrhL